MTYLLVKTLHLGTACLTLSGFMLRGYWMMTRSDRLHHRITRIAPHIIDTVFLSSGIALVLMLNLNAFSEPWLVAKFAGLILYIVLGTIAIKRGSTMQIRVVAFVSALAVFAYIAGIALTKSAASWLHYLSG